MAIDQVGKCLLVAALCTYHEICVHAPSNVCGIGSDRRYNRYGRERDRIFSIGRGSHGAGALSCLRRPRVVEQYDDVPPTIVAMTAMARISSGVARR